MSDLRDALKRASGVSGTERPDHARIQSEGRARARRRRVSYALAATGAAALTVVGGLALADADLFGGGPRTVPAGPAPALTESPSPVEPDAPITVDTPQPGDTVSKETIISGTANVYEGTVVIRVRTDDSFDRVLGTTFATAECGSGCRGRYSTRLVYEWGRSGPGTIEIYSESAETGEPLPETFVEIPVFLESTAGPYKG